MFAAGCTKRLDGVRNVSEPSVAKAESRKVAGFAFPTSRTFLFAAQPKCGNYRPFPQTRGQLTSNNVTLYSSLATRYGSCKISCARREFVLVMVRPWADPCFPN